MKKLNKLTTAAIALATLASCSSDDLFNEGKIQQAQNGKQTLTVTQETLNDGFGTATRAMSDKSMANFVFEANEAIAVYDNSVDRWDGYTYDGNAFTLATKQDLADGAAQFALYPFYWNTDLDVITDPDGTDEVALKSTSWTKKEGSVAYFSIPKTINYKEDAENNTYWCNLPKFGNVTNTNGKLETMLHYITAALRISLKNVSSNCAKLKIEAFSDEAMTSGKRFPLTGTFKAVLDTENPKNTELVAYDGLGYELVVNIDAAKMQNSVVFVPIVPCKNAIIKVSYLNATNAAVSDINGNKYKILTMRNYDRGYVQGIAGGEFDAKSAGNPASISQALKSAKSATEAIVITPTEVTTANADDYKIVIPTGMATDEITLNLQGLKSHELLIIDEDATYPYEGKLTVDFGATSDAAKADVQFDTKGADVMVKGNFSTNKGIKAYVKNLAIGNVGDTDATKVKALTLGTTVETITVNEKATVCKIKLPAGSLCNAITVSGNADDIDATKSAAAVVTVNGTTGNTTVGNITAVNDIVVSSGVKAKSFEGKVGTLSSTEGNITISGYSTTAISQVTATKGSVSVSGDREVTTIDNLAVGDLTIAGNAKLTAGPVKVAKGNISISDNAHVAVSFIASLGNISVKNAATVYNLTATKGGVTIMGDWSADPKQYVTLIGSSTVSAPEGKIYVNTATTGSDVKLTAKTVDIKQKNGDLSNVTVEADEVMLGKEVKDVTVSNEGTISITAASNPAINGELTLGNKVAMTLGSGYVNKITAPAAAEDAATLTFGNTKYDVAIKEVDNLANLEVKNASKWTGNVLTGDALTALTGYIGTQIWTASQLAYCNAATGEMFLYSDIDLQSKTWTMPVLSFYFRGKEHTISNVKLVANATTTAIENVGLFKTAPNGGIFDNLKIVNVTTEISESAAAKNVSNIGALVGNALGSLTIDNVTVTGSTLKGATHSDNIGGLVGNATGALTIKKSTAAVAITGQYNLGGLVGNANAAVTIDEDCKATNPTFTYTGSTVVDLDAGTNSNAGSIGIYIGKANGNVTAAKASTKNLKNLRENLGFKTNFIIYDSKGCYYFGPSEIGLYGSGTIKIDETTLTSNSGKKLDEKNDSKYNYYLLKDKWNAANAAQ